jgi:hypothetical protein
MSQITGDSDIVGTPAASSPHGACGIRGLRSATVYSPRRNVLSISAYQRNGVGIQTFEAGLITRPAQIL